MAAKTVTPIAPSYEERHGVPKEKREIKAPDSRRTVQAGMINVRVLVYRKEVESTPLATRHIYRLLFIHDKQDRQYALKDPDGRVHATDAISESELSTRLSLIIKGVYPNPGAWTPKTEEYLFMLKDGFEFYTEIESAQIGHTIKESA